MKKIVLITLAAALSACSLQSPQNVSGTFKGDLPCPDSSCEKIQAELILNSDQTYTYNPVYYFKNDVKHPFTETGKYHWDEKKANVIRLDNSGNLAVQISKDHVEFCDADGNLAKSRNNYKLLKVK